MELETRKKENKAKSYIPNERVEEFIKLVGNNSCFVNLFIAANGVGKSASGANIITNICFGVQNNWFEYPLFKKFPYLKRGRIISDPTTIKEKIIPELKKWFPSNRYEIHYDAKKEGKNYESKWVTDTGFEFDIMSNEQEAKEFESTDLGWIWFDEPSRKDVYIASVARTRAGGIIFWTMTPLDYSAWIEEDLYAKRDGTNIEYIEADVEDNCKEHSKRGVLEHKNIQRMIAQYPEDEREARIHGKFGHLLGKIIKSFNRKIHVIRPFEMKFEDFAWFMALDTHPQVDEHALWMAINNQGQKYIVAEFIGKGTLDQIAYEFKRIEGGMRIEGRLIEPAAFNKDERSNEQSFGDKLKERGFEFELGSKDLVNGIKRMQDAFSYEMRGNDWIKKPEVFIFDTCPVTIKQIESYVWVKNRGKNAESHTPRGIPIDKNDHQPENLRRLLMRNFNFIHQANNVFSQKPYQSSSDYEGSDNFQEWNNDLITKDDLARM
jgi:phage terminase large subunit-like protein